MTLLLWYLLVPYAAFVVLFSVFTFMDVMHMVKFGTYTLANYFALLFFLIGTVVIFWATSQLVRRVDWTMPIGNLPGASVFSSAPDL